MTEAVKDLISAGRQAIERNDWEEAYDLLQSAAATGQFDAELFEDLARSAWWTGRPDECIDAREQAFAHYMGNGQSKKAALVALDLAEGHFHKQAEAIGLGWVKKADRLLGNEPEGVEHGWLSRTHAVIAFEAENDLDSALELASRAYQVGTDYGDANLQALALHDEGRVKVARGDVEEGMALMDEAMVAAIGGQLGALYTGKIYCNMIDICEQLADYRRAGDWSDAARRWCERAGNSSGFPGVCRIHRAEILRLRGEWADAEEEAEKASHELGNFIDFSGEAFYEIGEIRLHMGDHERAEEAFRQAHSLGRDPQPGLAELHLAKGNPERAWTLLDQSLAGAIAPLKRARLLPVAVDVAIAREDLAAAGEAVRELESIASEYGSAALVAYAAHGRGSLLLADGDGQQALPVLQSAVDLWRKNDLPYLAARSRMILATAYQREGALDSAELEYAAARKTFVELGAAFDAKGAAHALKGLTGTDSTGQRSTTTLMFTDIVDSTPLIGVIGDEAWEQLLGWHHRTLRSLFASEGGREIENTGDGFFVAFDRPRSAIDCAVAIQQGLAEQRTDHGFAPGVRIGLHVGEVTEVGGSLAGEEVHKAARICAQAAAGEILASREVVQLEGSDEMTGEVRLVELKGFEEKVEVVSLAWQ